MSAPGSPSGSRRSPLPYRNEYVSSYNEHFGASTPRPSSAPPSTSRRDLSSSPSRYNPISPSPTSYSPPPARSHRNPISPSSPSTPRYEDSHSPNTSRYAKYTWNQNRNPLLEGDITTVPSGKKSVPSYFENLEKFDEDTKRLSRKSRPEATPFMIDPTRAGIPTLIQKIRTHEEDIYHKKRPSTAPSASVFREEPLAAGLTSKNPGRRPCQIEKFNVKRNPLIEGGEFPPPRRTVLGFNKESEGELQMGRKTLVVPPSLQKVTRTNEYYIPGEVPAEPAVRLRLNHPEDNDVFNHSHPLVAPAASHLTGALEREHARESQEKQLEKAYHERVSFYNDEIKKFKAKAKLKTGGI